MVELLWFVVVGVAAGWIAGIVMKGSGFGLVGDLVVGVVGALVGGVLFRAMGVTVGGGLVGSLAVAAVGAILLLVFVRLIRRL